MPQTYRMVHGVSEHNHSSSEHNHHTGQHTGQHSLRTIERRCDVAVIGGSAAGLAAALQLGRQRRSVIVVDAGEPRNAPASHMHGYLGHEGLPPVDFLSIGRDEVRKYGGEVVPGTALEVTVLPDGNFRVALSGGHSIVARRLLAATGLVDELPAIQGLAEQWGRGVIHCPFCHGYEVRDQRVVHVATHAMSLHPAPLLQHLTDRYTIVLHEGVAADDPTVLKLRTAGVDIVDDRVRRIVATDGVVTAVELEGGEHLPADAVLTGTRFRPRADLLTSLGITTVAHMSGLGDVVPVDPTGATTVAGVYAAGNVTDPSHQVLQAAAHGSWVGAMIAFSLAGEDLATPTGRSANEADWDLRYSGAQVWSGNPNGTLVREMTGASPGRALDVGAGEGGDAVWLAEQGWIVTANDISQRALDRAMAETQRRGLPLECNHADANDLEPFASGSYDLVTAHYASTPRTADNRGVQNLVRAVAPGGTLLVVSHDLQPMRKPIDVRTHSRPFDPDAYVRVEDVTAFLSNDPEWVIEVNETRPRPPGAASAGHHVDDVVFRARRLV